MRSGSVSLIGAGPGRADYLTLAAIRYLKEADIVLYDALLSADIQAFFPSKAKALFVGKRCGQHSFSQAEINERLIFYARQGLHVVRLKGGDPFIFGRGAEEVAALQAAQIPYRIVPGISALNGIAAAVGLPLTARTESNEFRVIQGHNLPHTETDWRSLATYQGTLVIFMGIKQLPIIISNLLKYGAPEMQEIAIVESDSDGHQLVSKSSLAELQQKPFQKQSHGPGIIYIGANVKLMPYQQPLETQEKRNDFLVAHLS